MAQAAVPALQPAPRVTRPRKVSVALWPWVATALTGLLLWDGVVYLADPPSVPPARAGQMPNDPWVWLRGVPGGLRTHGLLLLLAAGLLLFVLASRRVGRAQLGALAVVAFYGVWACGFMVAAWPWMPDPVWSSPSKFALIAVLTLGLIASPRDPRPRKG